MRRPSTALALGLMLLSGCTQEAISGDSATYTYATWVFVVSALGALALVVTGFGIVRQERKFVQRSFGIGLVVVGLGLLLGFAPRVFFTHVTVDGTHVEGDDRALWFVADPNKRFDIPFADVVGLEEKIVEQVGRKNRTQKNHYLVFRRASGVDTTVLLTSLVAAARPRIEAALQKGAAARQNPPVVAQTRPATRPVAPPGPPALPLPPAASVAPPPAAPRPSPPAPATPAPPQVAAPSRPPAPPVVPDPRPPVVPPPPRAGGAFDIPPERAVTADTPLAVGATVEIYRGEWIPAEVTELLPGGMVKVQVSTGRPPFPIPQPRSRLRLPE
jgi:hypothetical protein